MAVVNQAIFVVIDAIGGFFPGVKVEVLREVLWEKKVIVMDNHRLRKAFLNQLT